MGYLCRHKEDAREKRKRKVFYPRGRGKSGGYASSWLILESGRRGGRRLLLRSTGSFYSYAEEKRGGLLDYSWKLKRAENHPFRKDVHLSFRRKKEGNECKPLPDPEKELREQKKKKRKKRPSSLMKGEERLSISPSRKKEEEKKKEKRPQTT